MKPWEVLTTFNLHAHNYRKNVKSITKILKEKQLLRSVVGFLYNAQDTDLKFEYFELKYYMTVLLLFFSVLAVHLFKYNDSIYLIGMTC